MNPIFMTVGWRFSTFNSYFTTVSLKLTYREFKFHDRVFKIDVP